MCIRDRREPSGPGTSTSVLEREQTQEQVVEPGDHERFAHYVRKEKITEAMVLGTPVVALCGKVWVPDVYKRQLWGKGGA